MVALPCKQGSFSTATDLTSQAECTLTDVGKYSVSGSPYLANPNPNPNPNPNTNPNPDPDPDPDPNPNPNSPQPEA